MAGWSIIGNRYPFTYSEPPERVVLRRTDYSDSVVYVPERTCEFKPYRGPISDTDEEGNRQGVCSECSAYMHEQFCYCPNCGAKVVE